MRTPRVAEGARGQSAGCRQPQRPRCLILKLLFPGVNLIVACSRNASNRPFAFSAASIFRLIVRST
jgi:hypothetical protein